MTMSDKIDPSTLILKIVGGTLDGKLLPVTTQKCFLAGGDDPNSGQCTIIRGPSGTALRSIDKIVYVNGKPDSVHWLQEGDGIAIGQMRMVVQQLGFFPNSAENQARHLAQIKAAESEAEKPTEKASHVIATSQVERKTPQLAGTAAGNEVASEQTTEAAPKSDASKDPSSDTSSNTEASQSEPAPKTRNELSEDEQKANEARLERALQSLAGLDKDSTPCRNYRESS